MTNKVYKIRMVIGEYDHDGFWDVFDSIEMANNKEKLFESFDKIVSNARIYIEKRIL